MYVEVFNVMYGFSGLKKIRDMSQRGLPGCLTVQIQG